MTGFSGPRWILVTLVIWGVAIVAGLAILVRYSNTPGTPAAPPREWPAAASIPRSKQHSTLVLFVHPQCPCSRASIGELARIIARCRNDVETTVLFTVPRDAPSGFERGDLWNSAVAIPTVHVLVDSNAADARRFGARTSGQAVLYDRYGRLSFNGGITVFRGHSGDNDGRDSILQLLSGLEPRHRTTPVFGCALFGEY